MTDIKTERDCGYFLKTIILDKVKRWLKRQYQDGDFIKEVRFVEAGVPLIDFKVDRGASDSAPLFQPNKNKFKLWQRLNYTSMASMMLKKQI